MFGLTHRNANHVLYHIRKFLSFALVYLCAIFFCSALAEYLNLEFLVLILVALYMEIADHFYKTGSFIRTFRNISRTNNENDRFIVVFNNLNIARLEDSANSFNDYNDGLIGNPNLLINDDLTFAQNSSIARAFEYDQENNKPFYDKLKIITRRKVQDVNNPNEIKNFFLNQQIHIQNISRTTFVSFKMLIESQYQEFYDNQEERFLDAICKGISEDKTWEEVVSDFERSVQSQEGAINCQ